MKFIMKLHVKYQRLCLLRLLDLNDLAGADGVAGTTALAVLFLFWVPRSRPILLPGLLLIATSGATSWVNS
jgi:hypothetical protein